MQSSTSGRAASRAQCAFASAAGPNSVVRRGQQERQPLDVRDRADSALDERRQGERRVAPALEGVDVRVGAAAEDAGQRVGHRLRHVAVQVEGRDDRHPRPDAVAQALAQVGLDVVDPSAQAAPWSARAIASTGPARSSAASISSRRAR